MFSRIGIIGAMEVEISALKEKLDLDRVVKKASMEFYAGTFHGKEIIAVRSGIGKINAAVCAQILIDIFDVDAIINTGIAGSLKNEINIGDIVISTETLHHDFNAVGVGYPIGQVPGLDTLAFPADERLANLAYGLCKEVNPDISVFRGRIVSGDQFISDRTVKERISKNFGGFCTEMEGAAISQTAYLNNVPFVIIRAVSDKADDSASCDYPVFEMTAAERSLRLTERIIESV
jgi:adenosylhomocysteine nucleosidase